MDHKNADPLNLLGLYQGVDILRESIFSTTGKPGTETCSRCA